MNFFQHQQAARRKTGQLVVLFVVAVVGIIGTLYLAGLCADFGIQAKRELRSGVHPRFDWWRPDLLAAVAGGALAVILGGTLYKLHVLAGGGAAVATRLGGRLVIRETANLNEKKLFNVVEEMAIAAGVPVPLVFLLPDEEGINAFAAGFSTSDAVIGVTRGAIEKLSRDELQGVIAHEFSHILNGDMRLNIRLIGVLNGILLIALIGIGLLRAAPRVRGKNSGGAMAAMGLSGLVLCIVGYVGLFVARMIKSAVCRQREFLADASAVDFTRNPAGIAGALRKIGGFTGRARLHSPAAEEASHMFFGNGVAEPMLLGSLLATHPPLLERIKRIDPTFADGVTSPEIPVVLSDDDMMGLTDAVAKRHRAEQVVESVGRLTPRAIATGAGVLLRIPPPLRTAASMPMGAMGVIYAMLLADDLESRNAQTAILTAVVGAEQLRETLLLHDSVDRLDTRDRLPLADLAAPSLRSLSAEQLAEFRGTMRKLIEADDRVSLFEFALHKIVSRRLSAAFGNARKAARATSSYPEFAGDCGVLISAIANIGSRDPAARQEAFDVGVGRLPAAIRGRVGVLRSPEECRIDEADAALDRLAGLTPDLKQHVVFACASCALADASVSNGEWELLRAILAILECPMPTMLAELA